MKFSMHLGSWLVPAAISLVAFGWARRLDRSNKPSGDYSFAAIAAAFVYGGALIASLIVWLIWALAA